MQITQEVERLLATFDSSTPNFEELARLKEFLRSMKDAGIAKTREFNLPLPDTLGKTLYKDNR
jgi:hypothetical protein